MKKILLIVVTCFFVMFPLVVNAEVKSETLIEALESEGIEHNIDYHENEDQVTIYFFRKSGDVQSNNFLKHIVDIYEDKGDFFKLKIYEVSENKDNLGLLINTFDYLSADYSGAPFIVIGGTYFVSYNETVDYNLEKAFTELYISGSKGDVIEEVLTKYYRNDFLIMTIVIAVFLGISALIIYSVINNKISEKKNTQA